MKKAITALLSMLILLNVLAVRPVHADRSGEHEPLFGTLSYASAISGGAVGDSFWYSDEWLTGSPEERIDGLALVSAQLSACAGSAETAAMLRKLGFSDVEEARFDSGDSRDCAYVTGTKTIAADTGIRPVRVVVFQSHSYGEKGWLQNVTVNSGENCPEEHASYAAAAGIFLEDHDQMPRAEGELLWICGMSRGGAIANVVSAYLLERENAPALVCYTFEAPAVTRRANAHGDPYRCIHNYISDDDPVTMIPMWGMTRFGEEILLNTETPDELAAVLSRTNPDAARVLEETDANAFGGDTRGFLSGLIGKLTLVVPAREDYSAVHTVTLPGGDSFTYTCQDGLAALCHIVFGGGQGLGGLSDLLGYVPDLAWAYLTEAWVAANSPENGAELLQQAAQVRWDAAGACLELLPESVADSVRREDVYALLCVFSPLLVDHSRMTEGWELPAREETRDAGWVDLSTLTAAGGSASRLVFSHQPDVILARLKLMAPAPVFAGYGLSLTAPAAGDRADKAPAEILGQGDPADASWLRVERAAWLSDDDDVLADRRVHYLQVTLGVIGHRIPDDFRFALNGAEPAALAIRHENGTAYVDGIWAFRLGEPAQVTVRFDPAGHGDAPAPCSVESGTILRYSGIRPADPGTVRDAAGIWAFNGWSGECGEDWTDVTAVEDTTLHASWIRVIDDVRMTFAVPRAGDSAEEGALSVVLPDDLPLEVSGANLYDAETWEDVSEISGDGNYRLMVSVKATEGSRFPCEETEDGGVVYTGTVTINGLQPDAVNLYVTVNDGVTEWELMCEYTFRPEEG